MKPPPGTIKKSFLLLKKTFLLLILGCLSLQLHAQGSGNCLDFDGVNDYVDIGTQAANGCRTIEMWFKPHVNITPSNSIVKTLIGLDYNNGNESGLKAYYNFDHSSGTLLNDLTINNHDGELNNMTNADWVTSAVYYYVLDLNDESEARKGTITVIRNK